MVGGEIPPDCTAILVLVVGFISGRLCPGGSPTPDPYDGNKSNCTVANSTPNGGNITLVKSSEEKWNLWIIVLLVVVTVICWATLPKKEVAVIKAKYIRLPRV